MRVIAGEFRSRPLKSLPGFDTRPTPDRLRETLFNIIAPEIEDEVFLDAYAGTGAVGIEALSRGAARAIFIERSRSDVVQGRVLQYLKHRKADIVFLDPPYSLENEYREALGILGEEPPPLVIVQHSFRLQLEGQYAGLHRTRILKQGDNSLSFYRPE
jgi:16S rRNA (guanine966-N2)-methyltransferase